MTALVRHIPGYDGELTWHTIAKYSRPVNLFRVGDRIGQVKVIGLGFGPNSSEWHYDIQVGQARYFQIRESKLRELATKLNAPTTALALRPPMAIIVYTPPVRALALVQ